MFLRTLTEHTIREVSRQGLCADFSPKGPAERLALHRDVETPRVSVQPCAPSSGPLREIEHDLSRFRLLSRIATTPAAFSREAKPHHFTPQRGV